MRALVCARARARARACALQVHRLKGAIKAEEQIAAGLKEFGVLLNTELEFLKRKFVIETKFKSKQEAYQKKLQVCVASL
jgi:hypothetical protein